MLRDIITDLSIFPFQIIAFGSNPESSLRNFFPSFLARLGVSSSKALQEEVCLNLCSQIRNSGLYEKQQHIIGITEEN